jgi:hypothetical protein
MWKFRIVEGRCRLECPTNEPPDSTQPIVYSFGPEWFWFLMTLAFAGLLLHHQAAHLSEPWMPLPLLSWIVAPTWVGWFLILVLIGFMVFFSAVTRVTINPAAGCATSESFLFNCLRARHIRRPLQEVAAIRCSQEGLKTGRVVGGPVVAVFKVVLLVLALALLTSPITSPESRVLDDIYPVVKLMILVIALAGSIVLEWGTPTARLIFMDGKTWTLTRGADHIVYRHARHIDRMAGVRVISQSPTTVPH